MRRLPAVALATKVRLGFAVITGLYAAVLGSWTATLPWLLLVVVLDLAATLLDTTPGLRTFAERSQPLALIGFAAGCAGTAFAVAGPTAAPLALIPAYHAGLRYGRSGFSLAALAALVTALVVEVLTPENRLTPLAVSAWLVTVVILGWLGTFSQRLSTESPEVPSHSPAQDAIALMKRLDELASSLSGGLDAPASGSVALDALASVAPADRSAVLVGHDPEHLVPIALRGTTRLPWLSGDGVQALTRGFRESGPRLHTWSDVSGERCVLTVPVLSVDGRPIGLLVADRPARTPFTSTERERAFAAAVDAAPTLDAALLFGALRSRATLEERRRLARDMHDGVAQQLAAIGYGVDALRLRARFEAPDLEGELDTLRGELTTTMTDIRTRITDLRMAQRTDTGLGALVGQAVQDFGATTGVRTTVSLHESGPRLDPQVELALYRTLVDLLADTQVSGAAEAWVTLEVAAPTARLEFGHDGESRVTEASLAEHGLRAVGSSVRVEKDPGGRLAAYVEVTDSRPTPTAQSTRPGRER